MLDRTPDGVWMVELGSVVDPADLPQAVLTLLGAREVALLAPRGAAAMPPAERLVEALGGKRLLLVLDNCEHLVAGAAAMADLLLARCPALLVLATSREPLGVTGEVLHLVGPLALPDDGVTPEEALSYPAVRLFADRAAAARPGFAVDGATLGPVLRICGALDGIPLAIELAAARLRALSPEQVAGRLDDRFRLLAGGGRSAGPRHRTLRAVIDWSWDLLDEPERTVLRRLAVFAGGATLDAAERVCAAPGLDGPAPDEVLYLLAALVDKSLVVAGEGAGEVRYAMLETVRAYGAERRREAGEDEALRRAHAGYLLDLAEQADPRLRGGDQLRWIERLSAERDNLHAALRWAVDRRDAATAMRFVTALGWYWFLRSLRAEAVDWSEQALALPGEVPAAVRARALVVRAFIAVSGGVDLARSIDLLNQATEIVRGMPPNDPDRSHPMLAVLPAMGALFANDEEAALGHARALQDQPDPWLRAVARSMVGGMLVNLGEADEAEAQFDAALAAFRQLGERWGLGQVLVARAELSAARGRHADAVAALEEALEVFVGLGDREDVGQIMIRLAQQRVRAGRFEQARDDLALAGRIADEVGAEDQKLFIRHTLADVARLQGRLGEARELLDAAIADFYEVGHPIEQRLALLMVSLARVDLAAGEAEGAGRWCDRALRTALSSRDRPVIARVVDLLAEVTLAEGDAVRAATLLGMAEALRGMPAEAGGDAARVQAAARAALGGDRFDEAYRRGAAEHRDAVLRGLAGADADRATPAAGAARPAPGSGR
jgi:predicted ATPase